MMIMMMNGDVKNITIVRAILILTYTAIMMMMRVLGDDKDKSNKNICPITNDHGEYYASHYVNEVLAITMIQITILLNYQ